MTDVKPALRRFIVDELLHGVKEPPITDDTELLLSGIVDSLGAMRLVAFVETASGLAVPAGDVTIEHFRSVAAIADYIAGRTTPAV